MPTLEQIMAWAKDNQLMLGLVGSAIVGAMPEKLPGFREFPQWLWTWIRDTSKTFLNFKHGVVDPNSVLHMEKKEEVKTVQTKTTETKSNSTSNASDSTEKTPVIDKPTPKGPVQLNG